MPHENSAFTGRIEQGTGADMGGKDVLRSLILIEAAIEGADMGDKELQEAISCELLDVIKALSCQGRNGSAMERVTVAS